MKQYKVYVLVDPISLKIIFKDSSFKTFLTKKELGKELGFKGGFSHEQLDKRVQNINNIEEVLYNLCPLEW